MSKQDVPMVLPQCPIHKTQMVYRESHTPEQKICGEWYVCHAVQGCNYTELFPSKELDKLLNEQSKNIANRETNTKL
jgi:hypothetical protein